ncbi:MAG TPA: aromatic-ring-hydroxylating dioxygenase subunit beta [Caulobacteraceae bacterium]|nr:aromatic-ring-hydroxylating dioxygenase subunit beta [Caulobacteraceae bacterium]
MRRNTLSVVSDDLRSLAAIELHHEVAQFLYLEARLQDLHDYDGWEALWESDAIYWVPANGQDTDPERQMSIICDNRSRIHIRIEQLKTGRRHTQTPRSEICHLISNIMVTEVTEDEVSVAANALVYEDNLRGETLWASHNDYRLRKGSDGFRLVRKKVGLVNNAKPIFTLSFLI